MINKTVAFYTLGCKTNQFETQALERLLSKRGFTVVPWGKTADVYVVNTCSVTATADKKSRNAIRRARGLSEGGLVAVCGCSAQRADVQEMTDCGADIVIGTHRKSRLADAICQRIEGKNVPVPPEEDGFDFMPAGELYGRTRALLKVQDGCRNYCTYCIIPYLRNKLSSLRLDLAAEESARLEKEGYGEIVVTGIEISSYGVDLEDKPTLLELLKVISKNAPSARIRLGSLEPRTVTREWACELAALPNICPQFHLSLQSGCDRTLKAMGRRYTAERFLLSAEYLRDAFPNCIITTDLIVGFPDEREEDFLETLAFLKKLRPAQVHIFPYSRRKGTKADTYPGQLTKKEKEDRAQRAAEVCCEIRSEIMRKHKGSTLSVLFEQEKDGYCFGYSREYLPVAVKAKGLHNQTCDVVITDVCDDTLLGEIK